MLLLLSIVSISLLLDELGDRVGKLNDTSQGFSLSNSFLEKKRPKEGANVHNIEKI